MQILTVNTGSSSVRLALFEVTDGRQVLLQQAHYSSLHGEEAEVLRAMVSVASRSRLHVAHRLVHGGERFSRPCRIDAAVEADIERLAPLAPLHNPAALRWIRAAREAFGDQVEQAAVFDTAFYAELPAVASTYALPGYLRQDRGLRRYGFHGIAHRAMWQAWCAMAPGGCGGRVISFQLGSGSSVTALRDGRAVDTSMGFSPLEGLVMATRCGDIDAGLLLFLLEEVGLPPHEVANLLNHESGLLGLSGISGDMRELLASDDPAAELAIDIYCYRARKYLGAYMAVLGGVDAIFFGGGIGENCPAVRQRILQGMNYAGIVLSEAENARMIGLRGRISDVSSDVGIYVVPVDEGRVLAAEALEVFVKATRSSPDSIQMAKQT